MGEEVIKVATAAKPTNEHIAEMLTQVLRELGEVEKAQAQLAADLRRVARRASSSDAQDAPRWLVEEGHGRWP